LIGAGAAQSFTPVNAQEAVLEEIYGRGVHRYFARDYPAANSQLSLAINNGLKDPRAYYFRGLAAAAMGQFEVADQDWRTGATLEAKGAYGDLIGRSLARIQGPARLAIERSRLAARLAQMTAKSARDEIRYGRGVDVTSPGVQVPPSPAEATVPNSTIPSPDETAVPPTDISDPFADDPLATGDAPTVDATDALSGALEAAQPTPVAPSNAAPAAPATDPGFGTPPAADEPFPFGGGNDSGATDDPFGDL
jgi:hypothetical protein